MPFRRFFERGAKEPASQAPDEPGEDVAAVADAADAESAEQETGDDAEDIQVEHDEADWRERAIAVLPTGASTGSKRAEALYGAAESTAPTHYTTAIGCRVTDMDGNEHVDCTMALGAVALGYAEPNVTRAVVDAIAAGHVAGLSSWR